MPLHGMFRVIGRGQSVRPFHRLDALQSAAELRYRRTEQGLTEKMRETRTFDHPHEGEVGTTIENFSHRDAQIKVAETVVWTNMDAVPHTVTFGSRGLAQPAFDSGLMGPGQSFALKFDQPGTYLFTCTLHPDMNGVIVVTQ